MTPLAPNPLAQEPPRFQIRISRGLLIGFGGLVFLAVVAVLALGLWSAWRNTSELLNEKANSTIGIVASRVDLYLGPAEAMMRHLAVQFETGAINPADEIALGHYLTGALAATPQVRSVVYIDDRSRMAFALRKDDGADFQFVDVSALPVLQAAVTAARSRKGLYWGEVVHPETANETLINVRYAIHRGDRFMGLLAATVRTAEMSRALDEVARDLKGEAVIVYGDDFVLAHRKFLRGRISLAADRPLPRISELGDEVLSAFLKTQPSQRIGNRVAERTTGFELVTVEGEDYALITRRIDRYGPIPWQIVVSYPAADVADEFRRLIAAAIAGVIVLALALVAALLLARYLSSAVNRLAGAAHDVREFALDRVPTLPTSVFRELTEAAQAFNTMIVGLRWFETYVPKKLVQRLVSQGESHAERSVVRDVTIMFTDIAGFTARSEGKPAEETAQFLNEHFATLARCIEETGGTIDKFIGDAVMAFWGAPEVQDDHAARALNAALLIRAAISEQNRVNAAAEGDRLQVRVGLHSGEVIVGNIGAPGRINYTIVGDPVNVAARLEQLNKEIGSLTADVSIIASAATVEAGGPSFAAMPIGRHTIRGRTGEIDVYVL